MDNFRTRVIPLWTVSFCGTDVIPLYIRRFVVGSMVVLALVLGFTIAPTTSTVSTATSHAVPTVTANVTLASSYEDCVTAAVDIAGGFAARGIRLITTAQKVAASIGGLSQLIPGVHCGHWLGEQNVNLICAVSRGPWWQTRMFVWTVTGGAITRCWRPGGPRGRFSSITCSSPFQATTIHRDLAFNLYATTITVIVATSITIVNNVQFLVGLLTITVITILWAKTLLDSQKR